MSHYPSYYARQAGPPAQAPIASSMYAARPLAAQSAYSTPVGHNNAHPHDHKHPQPPPKHPAQRQRSNSAQGQTQPHVAQPASSQAQMQSYQRPSAGGGQAGQQYGQVQQPYNPSYAQTRPGGAPAPIQRGPVPYTGHQPYQAQSREPISTQAPSQTSAYAYPAPGQAQRTYSYPPQGQPVQQAPPLASGPAPYPPSTQSAYARGLSAFQQQQQRQQQQQQQHHYQPPAAQPAPAPQQYARPAVPPAQMPPPANSGGRRPLPTPGPSGTSPSRARPISMPPQRSQTYQQPPSASPYSHSSSSSLSHIIPTSSFASTSSLPSAAPVTPSFPTLQRDTSPTRRPLPPPSPGPRAPELSVSNPMSSAPIGIPRSTNMQFQGHHGPSRSMPVNTYGNAQATSSHVPSTSPQRRALPSSPNDTPTLSQLASGNLARRGTVSAMVSKFAASNGPPSPTKSTAQAPPPTSPYTPRAPVRSSTLPGTTAALPAAYQTHEDMYEDDDDPDASFSDEETASSAFDAAETESRASSQTTMSPQYGIRDLPRRSAFASGSASAEPQSPQYGILDLPRRAKSVYDRTRSWEQQSGQGAVSSSWTTTAAAAAGSATTRGGSVDFGRARNAGSPTKSTTDPLSIPPPKHPQSASASSLAKPVSPISPSKSPQPQQPQQEQKLPMPPVRHPKPSRTERTPSWTLPTANLDRIQVQAQLPSVAETSGTGKGTSMAFKFATMSLDDDEAGGARQTQAQRYQNTSTSTSATPNSSSRQTSPTRPSAYEAAMQFKQAQKQKEKEEEKERQQQQARMHAHPRSQPPSRAPSPSPSKAYPPFANANANKTPRVAHAQLDLSLDDAPPPSLRRSPSPSPSTTTSSSSVPSIPTIRTPDDGPVYAYGAAANPYAGGRTVGGAPIPIPVINLPGDVEYDDPPDNRSAYSDVAQGHAHAPNIVISPQPFSPQKVPVINLPDDDFDDDGIPNSGPIISVSSPTASAPGTPAMPVILSDLANSPLSSPTKSPRTLPRPPPGSQAPPSSASSAGASSSANAGTGAGVRPRGGGLVCGGCHKSIIGRIVSAMGLRWHPQCFKCCTCGELLEHVSSYEHDGKPYCHLDYHEVRLDLFPLLIINTFGTKILIPLPIGIRSAVLYLQDAHHRRAVHHTR